MNSLWKRTLSAFLAMVMVFGMLPVPGYAEEVVEEELALSGDVRKIYFLNTESLHCPHNRYTAKNR